ncbi:MAG: peptidase [Acidobacteria bacterium]|nr:peptidase [Acidobacteriota bacterium]
MNPASDNSSVILFFIDGIGIGRRGADNPFDAADGLEPLAHFEGETDRAAYGGVMVPTDPRLGVEGRPQSASGQTTILTGVNAPKLLGYHKQGFPNEQLREVIKENSIFKRLKSVGIADVVFANAYTPRFFTERPRWKSATTVAVESAEMQFRRLPDLVGGHAIFHDFSNRSLIESGFDVPEFSAADAAAILARLSKTHRFTLYEHFITDKIGHDQDFERARVHLPELAEFVRETLRLIDRENTTFILTSDHGNIEDLSVRNHTLNDVPTIIWGRKRDEVARRISDLSDIAPAIFKLLNE